VKRRQFRPTALGLLALDNEIACEVFGRKVGAGALDIVGDLDEIDLGRMGKN
jgi:hypothetical protein